MQYLADILELGIGLELNELETVRSDHKHIKPRHGPLESAGIFGTVGPAFYLDRVEDGILISHSCVWGQSIELIPLAHLALDLRLSLYQETSPYTLYAFCSSATTLRTVGYIVDMGFIWVIRSLAQSWAVGCSELAKFID